MARAERFTKRQVSEALLAANGLRAAAAAMLGCSPSTVTAYIDRHPELKQVCEDAIESTLDVAETMLHRNIKKGREASIFFFLKCKGKGRGYVEQPQQVELTGQLTIDTVRTMLDGAEKYADEE